MGRTLWKTAHQRIPTEGVSIGGFAFLIPASSACARSLLVPGTCDLNSQTDRHLRFRGSLYVERSQHSRTLNRLFSFRRIEGVKYEY
jgi:hypothetical protein